MTATLEEPTTLERLLGTVGDAMTREVVLLAADMTAAMALRRLEKQAVPERRWSTTAGSSG